MIPTPTLAHVSRLTPYQRSLITAALIIGGAFLLLILTHFTYLNAPPR